MDSVSLFLLLAIDWKTFVLASSGPHAITDEMKSEFAERDKEISAEVFNVGHITISTEGFSGLCYTNHFNRDGGEKSNKIGRFYTRGRIMRLDELSSLMSSSRRTTEDSSPVGIIRPVSVFILETNNQTKNKCLPKFVHMDNAFSTIKTAV